MISSMTGFGRGDAQSKGISVSVEIKSVNSRYLDFSLRMPTVLQHKELALKELLQEQLERGKINLNIHLDKSNTGEPDVTFSASLLKGYKSMLEEMNKVAGIDQPVTLQTLLQFDDLFETRDEDSDTLDLIWRLTRKATKSALTKLAKMRNQEGSQLEQDLHKRVDHIDKMLGIVNEMTNGRAAKTKEQLLKRIDELIDDDKLDEDRLEMEVALLADKMDITEEIIRTQSHLKFFREALENEESVGRRLNFLSQEINREINTIGSKANDSEISQYVVHAKESLEQIREQVQNIE